MGNQISQLLEGAPYQTSYKPTFSGHMEMTSGGEDGGGGKGGDEIKHTVLLEREDSIKAVPLSSGSTTSTSLEMRGGRGGEEDKAHPAAVGSESVARLEEGIRDPYDNDEDEEDEDDDDDDDDDEDKNGGGGGGGDDDDDGEDYAAGRRDAGSPFDVYEESEDDATSPFGGIVSFRIVKEIERNVLLIVPSHGPPLITMRSDTPFARFCILAHREERASLGILFADNSRALHRLRERYAETYDLELRRLRVHLSETTQAYRGGGGGGGASYDAAKASDAEAYHAEDLTYGGADVLSHTAHQAAASLRNRSIPFSAAEASVTRQQYGGGGNFAELVDGYTREALLQQESAQALGGADGSSWCNTHFISIVNMYLIYRSMREADLRLHNVALASSIMKLSAGQPLPEDVRRGAVHVSSYVTLCSQLSTWRAEQHRCAESLCDALLSYRPGVRGSGGDGGGGVSPGDLVAALNESLTKKLREATRKVTELEGKLLAGTSPRESTTAAAAAAAAASASAHNAPHTAKIPVASPVSGASESVLSAADTRGFDATSRCISLDG